MLVLAHAGQPPLPTRARFEVHRKIERAYALAIFHYYAIKSYSPQAEWILTYEDGKQEVVSLTPAVQRGLRAARGVALDVSGDDRKIEQSWLVDSLLHAGPDPRAGD